MIIFTLYAEQSYIVLGHSDLKTKFRPAYSDDMYI